MSDPSSADIDRMVEGQTVARRFLATVAEHGERTALRWKDPGGSWLEWTFADYADNVARATTGMADLGVEPGDRVVLMMRNCPEFHVLDMAALMCGATPISIYNSSAPDQVEYLVGHCGATVGFVEDDGFLAKFEPVLANLPDLRTLGIVRAGVATPSDTVTWSRLMAHEAADLETVAAVGTPEDLATVIYTSGTTGPPKGVMISNYNVCWTVESLKLAFSLREFVGRRLVSYLPMAHIAERMTSHYQQAALGYEVSCCPEPGQVAPYAREVRPNIMFGVPRVWEKIHAGVTGAMAADPEQARQFDAGVQAAKPLSIKLAWDEASEEERARWQALDETAFARVRKNLGLDQLDVAISGAAPIPPELLAWYRAVGVPMSEIYGMSENSGPMTWTPYRIKPGSVGPAMPGCEVALADDGEIICRGGNVFVGYLNDPEKTAEALDGGWLHTGDIGQVDDDGYYRIVDRKKELIITAGGKNISPANLEGALKMIPLVGQACAVGDDKPFVAALVVLDPDTAPTWAKQHEVEYTTMAELAGHPDVVAEIEAGLAQAMAPFNNAERVKKVKVLGEEWLPDSELLTPTSKLKRRGIKATFATEIDELYA